MNKSIGLAKKLEGLQTMDTIKNTINIKKSTALNIAYRLRKQGYLKTIGGGKQKRFYRITPIKYLQIGNPGLYDILNKYSKIKIAQKYNYKIINKKLTVEEALIRAIKTKDIRIIVSILSLFNHIKNWGLLSKSAEKEKLGRFIGALYDVARKFIRVRRMDKRTRSKLLKSKIENKFIIPKFKSKAFKDIEKLWNVYLPINESDLGRYKE